MAKLPTFTGSDDKAQQAIGAVLLDVNGDLTPLPTAARRAIASNTLTRRANTTPYAVGQIIGGSATAGFTGNGFTFSGVSRIPGGQVQINRMRMYKSQANDLGKFELMVFRAQPTITVADAGNFLSGVPLGSASAEAHIVASFSFGMQMALVGSDGAELEVTALRGTPALIQLPAGATDLFGVLRANGDYTPASGEQFSFVMEGYAF